MSIQQPGTQYSPCGKWGCGDHGVCGGNNTCTCHHGWSGVHCEVPPTSPPNPNIGDLECGNWGVYGSLVLGPSGYAPTCDCTAGMSGERCERECSVDSDCGTGHCDEFGRCICAQSCFSDINCDWGTCESGICTNGWTDVKCGRALSNECVCDGDDCTSVCGDGGECVNNTCVCDPDHTGLRCETQLAGTGEACTYTSDCKDVVTTDTCVDNTCRHFGNVCESDEQCRVICRDGVCTFPTVPPMITDPALEELLMGMLNEMTTAEGIAMMAAEEGIEKVPAQLLATAGSVKIAAKTATALIKRFLAKKSATVAVEGMAPVVTKNMARTAVKNISAFLARKGITSAALKMSANVSTGIGALLVAIQVIGMVLDIDDAAGFNTQMAQGDVDMYMKKMMQYINEDEFLREVGVQFPYEYLPEQTVEWRANLEGDVASTEKHELMLDYIGKLDVNSNGNTIIRAWEPPEVDTPERHPTLWGLTKNEESYSFLEKWWWLMLVLIAVVVITVGLGVGLSARKH